MILKMFGHLVEKFYVRMDEMDQINLDLVANGQGLHCGKRNSFHFLCLFLVTCGVVFNIEIGEFVFYFYILIFQYLIKRERESTFKI